MHESTIEKKKTESNTGKIIYTTIMYTSHGSIKIHRQIFHNFSNLYLNYTQYRYRLGDHSDCNDVYELYEIYRPEERGGFEPVVIVALLIIHTLTIIVYISSNIRGLRYMYTLL